MTEVRYPQLLIEKGRRNIVPVSLGVAVPGTAGALRAQLRAAPSESATLVAEWTITVQDAATGEITLELPPTWSATLTATRLYTDIILVASDETLMSVVECTVTEGVTA